ncbi:MAG TPA: CBS domain-containing protein [Pyrinomonadaceae bacterium]|nr:CBS domain-containing protein [Pyrinomonadaceae bacterium]
MRRYRSELDNERDRYRRSPEFERERFRREEPRSPYAERDRDWRAGRLDYGQGRFGEVAEYDYDEPRYGERMGYRGETERYSPPESRRDYPQGHYGRERMHRSRLRCRDIMTTDLAVATRDTPLHQVALMMKQEDTGVIPVVDYDLEEGNGREDYRTGARTPGNGKLVGLITDRDIVIRAVAEGKEANTQRAEEIMSTDIYNAKPNDRVVDVIRKMGDKQVRRIPVITDNGYLRGIISMADVALETEEDLELAQALEEISSRSSFWSRLFS